MTPIEGLTIIHVICAALGVLLFLVSLGLLAWSVIKKSQVPRALVACLVIGALMIVFPVTKKLEFNNVLNDITALSEKVRKDPGDTVSKNSLRDKVGMMGDTPFLTEKTNVEINRAKTLLGKDGPPLLKKQPFPVKELPHK